MMGKQSPASGLHRVAGIAASLVGTQAVTSVVGFAFWTLAARAFSASEVGMAGAAVAMMTLLGSLGSLGLGTLLIARLPHTPQPSRRVLVRTCVAASGLAGTGLGIAVPLVAVHALNAENLRPLTATPLAIAIMATAAGLTSVSIVLDQAVLTLGFGSLQLERNVTASVVKVGVLAVAALSAADNGQLIIVAWTIGNLVSLPLVSWRTRGGRVGEAGRRLVDLRLLRGMGGAAVSHHVLNLTIQAPSQIIPILVTVLVSPEENAYFTTAAMVAAFVGVLPYSLTIGLFAAARGGVDATLTQMRRTVPLSLGISLASWLALLPMSPVVLGIFGEGYADEGANVLRILAVGAVPLVIKDHVVALRRVQGRTSEAVIFLSVFLLIELTAAALGARMAGSVGLSVAWVVVLCVESAVLAPVLLLGWRRQAQDVGGGVRDVD